MADPLISSAMFEDRYGRALTSTEQTQIDGLLDDVSALIRAEADGELDDTTSADVPAEIVPVAVAALRRALTNPDGYGQESVDGYSYAGAPRSGVFLTRREVRVVRKWAGQLGVATVALEGYAPIPSSEAGLHGWDDWL